MKTKSTLEKAVKFVANCKFIFLSKRNIFQKNIFFILFFLTTTFSFAQSENVDSYLKNLESSGQSSKLSNLKHLLYDLQSSVYSFSGQTKVYGEKPTSLFTDINSLNSLNTAVSLKSDIEIATIKIETSTDLNKSIDLNSFSNFENLKYILIISNIQTNPAVINNLIKNDTSKYVLLYKISIGG
ncbi:hypothetical protein HNP35_002497 [Flavobacterium notoginsengisoli]|uniref:DUF4252 domain-containing protein n=1 Tax=Flavobacterium notoginsengisoli TaxID=1478199 RepID=A0ABR6QDR9_9FLAO|nr:hypothetical protein [Flavobacterium notoginsengisoli]MBB6387383.1 hypothetical protein [Flavobacterium notoginsengisoli]